MKPHVKSAVCAAVIAVISVAALFAPPALHGLKWLLVPLGMPAIPASLVTFNLGLSRGPENLPYYTDPLMYVLTFLLWWGIIESVGALWRRRRRRAG